MPGSGELLSVLLLATVAAAVAAWVIAWRYRRRMHALMALRPAPAAAAGSVSTGAAPTAPAARSGPAERVTWADNRRAGLRLSALLVVLSLLIAASSALLWYRLAFPDEPLAPRRVAVVALLHAWPVVPALALLWRWPWRRLVGALLLWCALALPVIIWRQIETRPAEAVLALAIEIGPTMVLVALLFLGGATRAIAPWLILPLAALVALTQLGMDALTVLVERRSPLLMQLAGAIGAEATIAAFALVPWLIAWWPLRAFARGLARAYTRRWLSDLLVVFSGVWTLALLDKLVTQIGSAGPAAFAMLLPLAWIPLLVVPYGRIAPRVRRPPTLLVLRVFQQDAQVQALYDHVVERWRLSGPVVMIAGTDLADRTIGADDVFTFLDGRLAERFVGSPHELARRLDGFVAEPDLDGRWRVEECYCHDTTWQDALRALVGRSDVVLMDLRGFQAHNAGCRFELETLSGVERPLRVVVLADGRTDRAAAQAAIAPGRQDRFAWIEATRFDARCRREVLERLFD